MRNACSRKLIPTELQFNVLSCFHGNKQFRSQQLASSMVSAEVWIKLSFAKEVNQFCGASLLALVD